MSLIELNKQEASTCDATFIKQQTCNAALFQFHFTSSAWVLYAQKFKILHVIICTNCQFVNICESKVQHQHLIAQNRRFGFKLEFKMLQPCNRRKPVHGGLVDRVECWTVMVSSALKGFLWPLIKLWMCIEQNLLGLTAGQQISCSSQR